MKVTPQRCTPTTTTIVPTKYQLHISYGFQDIAQIRFSNSSYYSKVKSRSHHDTAHLHLTVSEIKLGPETSHHQPTKLDAMGEIKYIHNL